ncbi:DNA-binding transcriptional ArsR family regulator [Rhodococcus sp. LBL1]|nr:DNA-binding transcriptional ArsR family regulator [Rhodococcus sp. LBL1]MDH6681202.1 DNA-binding transcriptional ArsR family regulator [Rhodococcus sp. LBL2]
MGNPRSNKIKPSTITAAPPLPSSRPGNEHVVAGRTSTSLHRYSPGGDRATLATPIIAESGYHRHMTIDGVGGCLSADTGSASLDSAVALFHSLSDGTRLAIVRRLAQGEARVADLVGELGLAQSTVSAHVACLRDCKLVEGRPEGRQVFYSLARPELLDLLAAAETVLAATGSAIALCPNYGTESTSAVTE